MEYSPYSGLEKTPFRYAAWKIACITGVCFRAFQKSSAKRARSARYSQPTALALVADAVFSFRGCLLKEASVVFSGVKRTAEERSYDWSHARTLPTGPERLKLHYLSSYFSWSVIESERLITSRMQAYAKKTSTVMICSVAGIELTVLLLYTIELDAT